MTQLFIIPNLRALLFISHFKGSVIFPQNTIALPWRLNGTSLTNNSLNITICTMDYEGTKDICCDSDIINGIYGGKFVSIKSSNTLKSDFCKTVSTNA